MADDTREQPMLDLPGFSALLNELFAEIPDADDDPHGVPRTHEFFEFIAAYFADH